jgi:hypothetical protein
VGINGGEHAQVALVAVAFLRRKFSWLWRPDKCLLRKIHGRRRTVPFADEWISWKGDTGSKC